MLKELLFLSVALPCVFAFFNNPIGAEFPPATGELLQCAGSAGVPPIVGLSQVPRGTFLPGVSGFEFPLQLNIPGFNPGILNLLTINTDYQALTRPLDFDTNILFFPKRDEENTADFTGFRDICGEDVLANAVDGVSTRNEDQGTFVDIASRFNSSWHQIFSEGITAPTSTTPSDELDGRFRSELLGFFRDMLQLLECRVAFAWADAGPTYFPRYFRQGFCLSRSCSIPDRDEFTCHEDLSFDSLSTLEAARWDCCWTYTRQAGYEFKCGFRKVVIPIVCDCDCRCIDKAGT